MRACDQDVWGRVFIFGEDMRAYAPAFARMRACSEDIWGAVLIFGEDMRAHARL